MLSSLLVAVVLRLISRATLSVILLLLAEVWQWLVFQQQASQEGHDPYDAKEQKDILQ